MSQSWSPTRTNISEP